jgi:hypothetical protein
VRRKGPAESERSKAIGDSGPTRITRERAGRKSDAKADSQSTAWAEYTACFCDSSHRRNADSGQEAGNDTHADPAWRASEPNDAKTDLDAPS